MRTAASLSPRETPPGANPAAKGLPLAPPASAAWPYVWVLALGAANADSAIEGAADLGPRRRKGVAPVGRQRASA